MKRKQISVLLASIVIQLVLGVIYIWGVFQPYVSQHYGWSVSTTSLTFSFVLAFVVVGGIIGGYVQDKYSPRPVVLVSGLLIGIGSLLAAFTKAEYPVYLYLTYGVLAGSGIGSIYTTTIAVVQKWFPEKKGLAVGLVISALGFGGVVFTPIANYALRHLGVSQTFMLFAAIYTIDCLICGWFIVNPPEAQLKEKKLAVQKQYSSKEMLRTSAFYRLVLTMLFSLPAYFLVSPLIKIIGADRGMTDVMATTLVMVAAVLNSCGRFLGPLFAAKVGNKGTVVLFNGITIIAVIGLIFANWLWSMIWISLIALAFGGLLGMFPLFSANFFGTQYAGANYGFVLIGYGIAAIFAPKLYDLSHWLSPWIPYAIVAVCSLIGGLMVLMLNPPKPD